MYNTGAVAVTNAGFGQGKGNIYLDNVQCNGDESNLLACSYSEIHNCGHYEDAGVECNGPGSEKFNLYDFYLWIIFNVFLQVNVHMEILNLLEVLITQREE